MAGAGEYTVVAARVNLDKTEKGSDKFVWETYLQGEPVKLTAEEAERLVGLGAVVEGTKFATSHNPEGVTILDPQEATGQKSVTPEATGGPTDPATDTTPNVPIEPIDVAKASYPELQTEAKRLGLDSTLSSAKLKDAIKERQVADAAERAGA